MIHGRYDKYHKLCVTSQGERVPRGMGIQYSRTNILGDMS